MEVTMTDTRVYDVLTIGGIDMDLVLTVPELPGADLKVFGDLVGNMPGGPAANFACAASRLGLRVSALAEVGEDQAGQMIIDDFASYGVDTSLIQVRPGGRTCFTIILIPPSGEKAIVIVPTFQPEYSLPRLSEALRQTRLIYLMPQNHEQFLAMARRAHECGAEVMIDVEPTVGANHTMMRQIMAEVDIASFNQFGFSATTGETPSLEAARRLLDTGPHTVVVTLGSRGALAVTHDQAVVQTGFAVQAVDTTGAGDTFNAAFVSATVSGLPLADRLRFANGAGALSVTGMGPRGRLPTADEVWSCVGQVDGAASTLFIT
jgi:sugar/nucleoside kinase (ribokinase family)